MDYLFHIHKFDLKGDEMISSDMYLKELLLRYQASFDITENFKIGNTTFPAYAWFHSLSEKYVLKKEAQLWAVTVFEHVFFIQKESLDCGDLEELTSLIKETLEPVLVRKNEKYPGKDHMCSYLTFVIILDKAPDESTKKAIKKFHFDKGYLFNFRGHSEARLAVTALDTQEVFSNYGGKELKSMLCDIYKN